MTSALDMITMAVQVGLAILLWPLFRRLWRSHPERD